MNAKTRRAIRTFNPEGKLTTARYWIFSSQSGLGSLSRPCVRKKNKIKNKIITDKPSSIIHYNQLIFHNLLNIAFQTPQKHI